MILTLIGGIGLFLLGMLLMTDGLKAVAGDALRQILSRFVSGPFSAMSSWCSPPAPRLSPPSWLGRFAAAIARLIPERGSPLTRHLDKAVTSVPAVAVEAARRSVMEIAALVIAAASARMSHGRPAHEIDAELD